MENIIVKCPHCDEFAAINILEINCAIFRHGVFKDTLEPIPPHSTKEYCDNLKEREFIFGCGKPFKLIIVDNRYIAEICDYI